MQAVKTTGQSREGRATQKARLLALLVAAGMMLLSTPLSAQSRFGCEGLETLPTPMVEGLGGVFYRIDPDLLMETRVPDAVVTAAATLSRALEERGTRLIFVPVPTKALVMPGQLGPEPIRFAYDVRTANALYADSVSRLRAEGVTTVDAVESLVGKGDDEPVVFKTDSRLTNHGLRMLAEAIAAEAGTAGLGAEQFVTEEVGDIILESRERFKLQFACQAELPQVRTKGFKTLPITETEGVADIAVAGTTMTGAVGLNFAGFLAKATGHSVAHEIIADDATAALAAYLTSDRFKTEEPAFLVWLLPIWSNPSRFGDQPLRELVAAANGACGAEIQGERLSGGSFRFDLRSVPLDGGRSLRLATADEPVVEAAFRFESGTGDVRSRSVVRTDPALATSRLYVPMSGLWPDGPTSVAVDIAGSPDTIPTLAVCEG